MAGLIGKVSILRHYKEAGRLLPVDEQRAVIEQVDAIRTRFGGRLLVSARAHWVSGEINSFGVEIYPDIEAVQKQTEALDDLNWFRYVEGESFLGIPELIDESIYPNGILQLQVRRGWKEQGYRVVQGKETAALVSRQIFANIDKLGGRLLLSMACRWAREDIETIRLVEWPDLDALRRQVEYEDLLNWSTAVDQKHYLGTRS